jgi:hypothetical protein
MTGSFGHAQLSALQAKSNRTAPRWITSGIARTSDQFVGRIEEVAGAEFRLNKEFLVLGTSLVCHQRSLWCPIYSSLWT